MNKQFIEYLASSGAIKFGDFVLKSGRKSPYFISISMLNTAKDSYLLGSFFAEKIKELFGGEFDTIYGPAYKGIPLAVSTAIALNNKLNMNRTWLFDRKEEKTHGDRGIFVGDGPKDMQRIIIVDDVFTTGGTKHDAIEKLRSVANLEIKGIVVAIDREEKDNSGKNGIDEFEKAEGIKVSAVEKISNVFSYLHNNSLNGRVYVNDSAFKAYEDYISRYGV